MIVQWLTDLVLGLLMPVLTVASFSAPAVGDLSAAVTIGSSAGQANRYLPVDQFVILILAGFVFDLSLTGARFFVWLYEHVPLKAT